MRQSLTFLLVIGWLACPVEAEQGRTGASPSSARACDVLTRDMVLPFNKNTRLLDQFPPEAETLGTSGTACEYGLVRLQLFSAARSQQKPSAPSKDYQPLAGVGDAAFFRSNPNGYAELSAWTSSHYFTLQISVPQGGTAESMKPQVAALANAVIAKLR